MWFQVVKIRVVVLWFVCMVIGVYLPMSIRAATPPSLQTVDSVLLYIEQCKAPALLESQKEKILNKALAYAYLKKPDSLALKDFARLSLALLKQKNASLFREANRKAILLSRKMGDSVLLAEAYWDLGSFFNTTMILDSAYYAYGKAQSIYEKSGNYYNSGRMLINMASGQMMVKDYVGSEATTVMALERLKPLDKYEELYFCYNNLGIVANDLEEYDRAIVYYNQALDYLNKLEIDGQQKIGLENNIGVVYKDKGDYPEASLRFNAVLQTDSFRYRRPDLYAKVLNNLADTKLKMRDTSGCFSLIKKAIAIKDSLGNIGNLSPSYGILANYYLYRRDTINAIVNLLKTKSLANNSDDYKRLLETLALLTKIDVENASIHGAAYIHLNDSLQRDERQARNKFARIRFETEELSTENQMLYKDKVALSKQNQMWIGLAAVFFTLGLFLYILVNQRAKNQKLQFQQEQQMSNQEIFNLMLAQGQKVAEVKRNEQKRISEELHDGVLGKMLGARMILTGLNKRVDDEAIQERSTAIVALKKIENEVRIISHDLSHAAYRKVNNFVADVQFLLNNTQPDSGITTHFSYDENQDWDLLIGDIKINIYRIVQESLQNAIKHASCVNFFVTFVMDEELFSITIRDDGQGFSAEKQRKGIGLRNISSRVSKMVGSWELVTAPNEGTLLKVQVPVSFAETTTAEPSELYL